LQLSLYRKDIRAQFEFFAIGSKEVLEGVFGLADRELGVLFVLGWHVFVTIMQVHLDHVSGQQLTEHHGVMKAHKEHVLVHELYEGLLREV
jgi:hypothetical protein